MSFHVRQLMTLGLLLSWCVQRSQSLTSGLLEVIGGLDTAIGFRIHEEEKRGNCAFK